MSAPESATSSGLRDSMLAYLEQKIGSRACNTWVSPARIKGLDSGVLKLALPNAFFVEWLSEHYLRSIREAASIALGRPVNVELLVDETRSGSGNGEGNRCFRSADSSHPDAVSPQTTSESTPPKRANGSLNPNYTFANFVVASSNNLACAASLAVAERPGTAYNPLFIYGGAGLGKTHMLHAIGHAATGQRGPRGACYVSAERFMNEMILSIQRGTALAFREKYRQAELLLIDDVHFLGGKESTQEEFFHTFNSLHEAGRQIVLTSDRPPKDIPRIEERLISRFTWGLVVDIQKPDLETRIAILNKKAVRQGLKISPEVALTIARVATSNIRELEGSLVRVHAHAQLTGEPLTPDLVLRLLSEILGTQRRSVTVDDVQVAVAKHFGLRARDLCGRRRTSAVALPRQVAMYICRAQLDIPLAEIGERFGGRDHTTVLYACAKIEARLKEDLYLRRVVTRLAERLNSSGESLLRN